MYAPSLSHTHASISKQSDGGAPTACTQTVSGSISLPSPGFFSPFPHGTGSLSVSKEYLALEDGPPIFSQDTTCPDLLIRMLSSTIKFRIRGYHPLRLNFPEYSTHSIAKSCQALPRSLAATKGISIDFFSYGYLDVSVHRVCLFNLCIQLKIVTLWWLGSPIRTSLTQRLFSTRQSFSQNNTSFIASCCQGIHRLRLSTWPYNQKFCCDISSYSSL